jgi:uncharacterized phiE125 gp8 family phage protein
MAALTVQDCKDYLRVEHAAEDTMFIGWLASAVAAVEAEIGRPIEPVERTWIIEQALHPSKLFVPLYPIAIADSAAATDDLVLVDGDGDTLLEDTDYRLDLRSGVITATNSDGSLGCFSVYPYTITAHVGLSVLDDYDRIEPILNAAILDVVADRYQRRNPATSQEATGGGVSTSYTASGLPQRVADLLKSLKAEPLAIT